MNKLLKRIVNGEFINVIYNDEIYLLVDEFICDKKHVIYFNSLNSDLFCFEKGKDFEIIEDEKLKEKVREENGLYKDEYLYRGKFTNVGILSNTQEITGSERRNIIQRVYQKFNELKVRITEQELFQKLMNLRIKRITRLKELGLKGVSSAYHIPSNTIFVRNDEDKDYVFFHEIVHALTGKMDVTGYHDFIGRGLAEGILDYVTVEAYNKNISSDYNNYRYNFDITNALHPENAAIASQLSFVLGDKFDLFQSLIYKDTKFVEAFYRKYGICPFLFLRYRLNKIYRMSRNHLDTSKEFDKLQDLVLRSVFNKEFENVIDEESAIRYFETLNSFGCFRAKKDKDDTLLKKYFNNKKEECSKKLNINLDGKVKYERVKFKNRYLENEYARRILLDVETYLSTNKKPDDKVNIYRLNRDNNIYGLLFINDELVYINQYDLNGSWKVNIDFDMSELEEIKIEDNQVMRM